MTVRIRLRPILPKPLQIVDLAKMDRELRGALDRFQTESIDLFHRTTRTWTRVVAFQRFGPSERGGLMIAKVYTNDRTYYFVNEGTRPHVIRARRAPFLRFRWSGRGSYRAKTRPRVMSSYVGGPRGPWRSALAVMHPGLVGRQFDLEVARRQAPVLARAVERAILMAWFSRRR